MAEARPARFAGKTALVTGGGRGIGRAIALGLAAEGARVVVFSRSPGQLQEVVERIHEERGTAIAMAGDVRRQEDVDLAVAAAGELGGLDILINCAGVFSMGPSHSYAGRDWQEVLETNLTGSYLCCQSAGRVMLAAGRGKIVNFASLLSFVGFPERAAYAASKGGVLQLTRVLGVEWARQGVHVNAIAPGMIQVETPHPLQGGDPTLRDRLRSRVPAGRLGRPADVVGPTLFLASEEADYIAGQVLVVDGGWLAYGYL
jgi:NAD(P)-dependent dehydrogenase (short-subunit alcohol dehydrogenase family)